MSRIATTFQRLQEQSRCAMIPFITAGDPQPEATVPLMHAMVGAGADILELGVPFSDPMAEGPVIQAACERALEHHINLEQIFAMVSEFRRTNQETPIVLMGYLNPVEVMGYNEFARQAADAGVDAVLTVDMPPDEADDYCDAMNGAGLDTIFLVAPTSTPARIEKICRKSSGFVYYVSLKGVTGAGHLDIDSVNDKLGEIRKHATIPIGVGFGIKDADSAARIAEVADAVVIGSAVVKNIADYPGDWEQARDAIVELLVSIRQGIDELRLAATGNG